MVLPCGICTPKAVWEKLQPTPKITSDWSRKWRTVFGMAAPPEPRARGWVSSKALLPSRLVHTGAASSLASSSSSS